MEGFGLLEQSEEDALHKSRLLSVEEKPFKRLAKRLLAPNSVLNVPPVKPSQPRAGFINGNAATGDPEERSREQERRQFEEDVALDFAAFNSSIARIQFLLTSNERERERYAAEKTKILEAAGVVRASTAELHAQLADARMTLEVRKTWDELSEKITGNRMLRPREDQEANLRRLEAEIAALERESGEYAQTWAERREQFGRIIKEGMELRRLIRDEKEEVERREGMEGSADGGDDGGDDDGGEEGEVGGAFTREATPAGTQAGTPRPDVGGATPLHPGLRGVHLGVPRSNSPSALSQRLHHDVSTPGDHTPHSQPAPHLSDDEIEEGEDTTMGEQGEIMEGEDEDNHSSKMAVDDASHNSGSPPLGLHEDSPDLRNGILEPEDDAKDPHPDPLERADSMDVS